MTVGIVIDSGTFATVIGVSFTACIGMIAYIVKTLAAIDSRVAVLIEKVGGMERREAARFGHGGYFRVWVAGCVALLAVILFWGALFLNIQYTDARQHDACVQRQNLYDGQVAYTKFLAKELGATPAQKAQGLRDLRKAEGPRPTCG